MPSLDAERGVVTVRLVFDGLPRSGKTTNVRSLSGTLSRPIASPGEIEGRTLFFDWMDYTGGTFEGHRICCQVVSVPGQPGLAARRWMLLQAADAIVFVVDSASRDLESSLEEAARLEARLRSRGDAAPAGLIVQANKRDLAGALPIGELQRIVCARLPRAALVEAAASTGDGVRETFVLAVRVALDRVRELSRAGQLGAGSPDVSSPEDLLERLQGVRDTSPDLGREPERGAGGLTSGPGRALAHELLAEVLSSREAAVPDPVPDAPSEEATPSPPDAGVPTGRIWPPVEGRLYLHEAMARSERPSRRAGGWRIETETGWTLDSPDAGAFRTTDEGLEALFGWARAHASLVRRTSSRRSIVLSPSGDGGARLWQVVQRERTIGDRIREAFRSREPSAVAAALLEGGRLLLDSPSAFAEAGSGLPIGLDSLGADHGTPVYVGLVPFPYAPGASSARPPAELLERELAPVVRAGMQPILSATPAILDRVLESRDARSDLRDLVRALVLVVLGEPPGPDS